MAGSVVETEGKAMSKFTNFDPEMYLDIHNNPTPDSLHGRFYMLAADFLQDIFGNGTIKGERLLDIGSGPLWKVMYAASWWFKEITLSDICEANLQILRDWRDGKRKDLDNIFNYALDIAGNREDGITARRRISQLVKHIIHLDVRQCRMLAGTEVEGVMYDAITLVFCQLATAMERAGQKCVVQNYTKHLKQGGQLILIDTIGETYYSIGKNKYQVADMKKDDILSLFEECGYEIMSWREVLNLYDQESDARGLTDAKGAFALVCRKR